MSLCYCSTSARSSKQLPTSGWGLPSAVISTASSMSPSSFTVSSWMSRMLLKITSTSCTAAQSRETQQCWKGRWPFCVSDYFFAPCRSEWRTFQHYSAFQQTLWSFLLFPIQAGKGSRKCSRLDIIRPSEFHRVSPRFILLTQKSHRKLYNPEICKKPQRPNKLNLPFTSPAGGGLCYSALAHGLPFWEECEKCERQMRHDFTHNLFFSSSADISRMEQALRRKSFLIRPLR